VLDILRERGVACDVIEYLKFPPDRATLERMLSLLDVLPSDLVRRDKRWKELGLDDSRAREREQVIELLIEHPDLMERPVVIRGERAVIARPPERVLELLDERP
jgi:arsenate reductase